MSDNDKAILVHFTRPLTDDELRDLHELLAGRASASSETALTCPRTSGGCEWPQCGCLGIDRFPDRRQYALSAASVKSARDVLVDDLIATKLPKPVPLVERLERIATGQEPRIAHIYKACKEAAATDLRQQHERPIP